MATKRVNIRVSENMHQWFTKRSEETGVSMSALMALALEEHMVQREAINGVNAMNKLIESHNNGQSSDKGE
jgi:hypothetical protein